MLTHRTGLCVFHFTSICSCRVVEAININFTASCFISNFIQQVYFCMNRTMKDALVSQMSFFVNSVFDNIAALYQKCNNLMLKTFISVLFSDSFSVALQNQSSSYFASLVKGKPVEITLPRASKNVKRSFYADASFSTSKKSLASPVRSSNLRTTSSSTSSIIRLRNFSSFIFSAHSTVLNFSSAPSA